MRYQIDHGMTHDSILSEYSNSCCNISIPKEKRAEKDHISICLERDAWLIVTRNDSNKHSTTQAWIHQSTITCRIMRTTKLLYSAADESVDMEREITQCSQNQRGSINDEVTWFMMEESRWFHWESWLVGVHEWDRIDWTLHWKRCRRE